MIFNMAFERLVVGLSCNQKHGFIIAMKQGKSEGFDRCDWPSNFAYNWIRIIDFSVHVTIKFDGWPRKTIGHLPLLRQALCIISNPLVNSNCSYSPETLNLGQNWRFSVLCDLEIWWVTLTNNRAPLLGYFKICTSFQSHRLIQTGVTVRKHSVLLKISDIFPLWPWNFTDDLEKR